MRFGGRGMPGVLHQLDGRRAPGDRRRCGAGAGAGRRYVGNPRRRRQRRRATGPVRCPHERHEHTGRARPGWCTDGSRWLAGASRCYQVPLAWLSTEVNAKRPIGAHMTRKRRPLSALVLIAVVGVIGACGLAALAGTGRGSSAGDTNAVNHEKAVEVADARVSTPAAPAGSLPSGSTASPYKPDPSTSSRSSAPSPTGKLPSPAHSSLPTTRRTAAGSTSANSPARSLPGQAVGAPRPASASPSAPSSTGTLPSTADSPVRPTTGTPAGSTSAGAPARSLPGQ